MTDGPEHQDAATPDDAGRGLVKSAERAVRIMETLADSSERLTLAGLQERTGYPRSSLYALLHTLAALKWIEGSDGEQAFGIGPRALLCGTAYLDRDPAMPFVTPQIERLRDEVGYTTHYARLDGPNVIYLATREATDSRRLTSRVGRQLPAHATALGKALLAELTMHEVDRTVPTDRLARVTENTLITHSDLHADLDETRKRGWAREKEENTRGLRCVAATVGYRIPATDAISCSMPVDTVTDEEMHKVADAVQRHCTELAGTLRRAGVR